MVDIMCSKDDSSNAMVFLHHCDKHNWSFEQGRIPVFLFQELIRKELPQKRETLKYLGYMNFQLYYYFISNHL